MTSTHLQMIDGLELNEADDGLIVYDEATDRVHHLNFTAAVILQLCDGKRDAAAIAGFIAQGFGLDEPPLAEIDSTLETLAKEGLVR